MPFFKQFAGRRAIKDFLDIVAHFLESQSISLGGQCVFGLVVLCVLVRLPRSVLTL
ncbi:hypothetical protein ACOJBO_11955 [Rhizobium beringeri]